VPPLQLSGGCGFDVARLFIAQELAVEVCLYFLLVHRGTLLL
jgi:hypothetical protein